MTVLLGARDAAKGDAAVKQLNQPNVKSIVIDIDDHASVQAAAEQVKKEYGGLDVLVNNAGMAFKGQTGGQRWARAETSSPSVQRAHLLISL